MTGIAGIPEFFVQFGDCEGVAVLCLFTDEAVSNVLSAKPESTLSSGFVGTLICWFFGLAFTVLAVLIAWNGNLMARGTGLGVLFAGAVTCGWARTAGAAGKLRLAAILLGGTMLLLIGELVLRNTMNYPRPVAPSLVPHESLGFVMDPGSTGVDKHGFRNLSVPSQVDVVAIGDQQTAGTSLPIEDTWPQIFGKTTNQSVYSLAVPGYGPAQYAQLVDRALTLKPRQVIIGLNVRSDLMDAVNGIPSPDSVPTQPEAFSQKLNRVSAIASLTQTCVQNALETPAARIQISHPQNPVSISAQQIASRTAAMNLEDESVRKAFLETISILEASSSRCRQSGAALTVLLIPSPEFVCGQAVTPDTLPPALQPLLNNEGNVRSSLLTMLESRHVYTIDAFPSALKAVANGTHVYDLSEPERPTQSLCEALAAALSQSSGSTTTN